MLRRGSARWVHQHDPVAIRARVGAARCDRLLGVGQQFDEIRDAGTVDAAWLTDVLHAAGVGLGHRIGSFDARSIGTGQVGENVRYTLEWDGDPAGLPASLVAKFPSASEVSRATATQVDTYRREVGFYRDIQHHVAIRTPGVHHIGWDPRTHDFVLVMEDICGAEQGDQLEGCDVERAAAVIDQAIGLHAPTWDRVDELGDLDWLAAPSPERTAQMQMLFGFTLPGFLDRYGARLSADERDVGRAVVDRYPALAARGTEWAHDHRAWCVTHADYRLDNILFGAGDGAPSVTVVDWQTTTIGIGPADVAYFVGAGLVTEQRRRHERSLVERYAVGMRTAGVDVSDDAIWSGYVLGTAGGYLMSIIASQIVEQTVRGDDMFVAMASRHASQITECGLLDQL